MTLWKLVVRRSRDQHLQATLNQAKFSSLPFSHSWNNLVKMYDLRMWYIQNAPHEGKALQYVHEVEKIHSELNYLNSRTILFRYLLFVAAFYGFYAIYDMPLNYDWQDYHEPKHAATVYGDLEEGGDEGGDDD